MKIRATIVAASLVGLVVAACGGSTGGTGARATATSSSSSAASTTATPTPTEQLNSAACDAAHQTMLKVKTAIDGWNGSTTDPATADQIRTYATELFSEEVNAASSVKDAIHTEAQGLVKFSIALSGSDDRVIHSRTCTGAMSPMRIASNSGCLTRKSNGEVAAGIDPACVGMCDQSVHAAGCSGRAWSVTCLR